MVRDAENSSVYSFDGFRLDVAKRLLFGSDGKAVPLKAKAFDTLLFLVENPGRVVERDELLAAVWPDTVVEENNLTQHISSLRRLFGEKPDEHRFIATVPGRGYTFVANVRNDIARDGHPIQLSTPRKKFGRWSYIVAAGVIALLLLLGFHTYKDSGSDGQIRSIAVLPFQPLTEQDRDESLQMGMTQELIDNLSGAEGLEVRSLWAVRRYASLDQDVAQAGKDLGVDAVLDATIQKSVDKVRVSVRLTRVSDSMRLWSDSFNQELTENILDVQESIAERVANRLTVRISAKKRPTENVDAYQLYLQGRTYYSKLAPTDVKQGMRYFSEAIKLDPNFALAYTGMAECSRSLVLSGEERPSKFANSAISAAERALRIEPQLAEAYAARGNMYFWFERDFPMAEEAFKRALDLNPKSAQGHINYAQLLTNLGRHEEAKVRAKEAGRLDPYSPYSLAIQGLVYQQAGMLDEALDRFREATDLDDHVWLAHMFAAVAHIDRGEYEEAITSARKASKANPAQSMSIAYESVARARLGDYGEAKKGLETLVKRWNEGYVPPYHIAIAYMGLGDHENALVWLERSFSESDTKIVFLKTDRIWDKLRSEPRFIELIKKMKFE